MMDSKQNRDYLFRWQINWTICIFSAQDRLIGVDLPARILVGIPYHWKFCQSRQPSGFGKRLGWGFKTLIALEFVRESQSVLILRSRNAFFSRYINFDISQCLSWPLHPTLHAVRHPASLILCRRYKSTIARPVDD
jgi:hypothetical protein